MIEQAGNTENTKENNGRENTAAKYEKTAQAMEELLQTVASLRAPDGCPWDRAQTHESLKPYVIEEAYEVNQGVTDLTNTGDPSNLIEELGDLLFQVMLQAQVGEDQGEFTIDDVIDGITRKMIHRHPHVFGGKDYDSYDQQQADWEKLKSEEEGHVSQDEAAYEELRKVPAAFPALIRGQKIAKKSGRRGLVSMEEEDIFRDMLTGLVSLESAALSEACEEDLHRELGNLLFAICRFMALHRLSGEHALCETLNKYVDDQKPE